MKTLFTNKLLLWLLLSILFSTSVQAQMYNDGPIRLRVWVHKVWSSANCGDLGIQEYNIKGIRARVRDASGTGYITSPAGFNVSFWGDNNRFYRLTSPNECRVIQNAGTPADGANGYRILDVTYPNTQVPIQFETFLTSAFEDDCTGDGLSCGQGSELNYDECCCLFGICALSDDYLVNSTGWDVVNFRSGVNGVVNYTTPILLNAGGEHKYGVVFAYQWDWVGPQKPLCPSPNYQDGNITVTCDFVGLFADTDWDGGTCGVAVAGNEDIRLKLLAKDNDAITPNFGNFPTGVGSSIKISQSIPEFNGVAPINIFNKTYNTTDQNFSEIKIAWDYWEEDGFYLSILGLGISCGSDDNYEGSDYAFPYYCANGDDYHSVTRVGQPGTAVFAGTTINWRESPPNTYNFIDIPCNYSSTPYANWSARFRYRWTIGTPTVSIATTDLQGCLGTPVSLTATTTNATYYQWQVADLSSASAGTCPAGANWTNVAGATCRSINFPQTPGTKVYRLVVYNRNGAGSISSSGAKYDSAVSNCVRVTYFPFAPPIVSAACGKSVPSGSAITFTVPTPPTNNAIGNSLSGWSYSWSISPTTNVTPTTGTGTTFSPVFTAAAAGTTYTVTLTVNDPCAAANAISTCSFTVTTPSCDQIYVAPPANGGNDANPGTATQPYATIANALANVSGSRTHIHVMGGATYLEGQLNIPANAIIDGGWEIVSLANGDWRKNSSLATTVNVNAALENNATLSIGYHRGVVATTSNWIIQDLTINVNNGAYQPTGTSYSKGKSIYGIYLNGATGFQILRTTVNTGNGTVGSNGTTPAGTGGAGGGGNGATSGGVGSTQGCYGSGGSNGGNGAAGAANNGTAGAAGTGGTLTTGSGCNVVGCDANGSNGNNGTNGGNGGTGSGYTAGVRPATPAAASPFYLPSAQASNGGNGGGGGGGGKGGGGDIGTCCTCGCGTPIRPDGGNGGNGGGGGLGGGGGWGGGGSFGIYITGASSGSLLQSTFNAGTAGTGGTGAAGQAGSGGSGGAGGISTDRCGTGRGGNGGSGGTGGAGGRGQDGANGLAQGTVNLSSDSITTTGGLPNGPNAAADYLKARYLKGCTNSIIEIEKAAGSAPPSGAFDLGVMGASLVNDQSPNTSTLTNTTGALTLPVQFATTGWKSEDLTTVNAWTNFIRITESRSVLPQITTTPKKICSGESVSFSIIGNSPNQDFTTPAGSAVDYEWRYRKYKDGLIRTTPVPAWTSGTGAGANTITLTNTTTDTVTFLIAARVRDKCCGWSIWVYDSVLVAPAINPPTAWTVCAGSPASGANVCLTDPAPLCVNVPTLPASNPAYAQLQYRYTTDNSTNWTAWSTTRPTNIPKSVGTTIVQTMLVVPSSMNQGPNCDTAVYSGDIRWTINDTVSADAGVVDVAGCGNTSQVATFSAATPAVGTGQWTLVSASLGVTSNPVVPTSSTTLLVDVPFGGNATYRWTVTNASCSNFRDVSVTTSAVSPGIITQQSDACYTCLIQNGSTYTYYDYLGNIIVRIEDLTGGAYSPLALGNTEVCTHIHPYTPQTWTVAYPDSMPYLRRWWSISPEFPQGRHARVTLFFTAAELASLQAKAAGTPYAFSGTNLRVSKFPGGGGGAFSGPNGDPAIHTPGGLMLGAGQGYYGGNTTWTDPVFSAYGSDYQAQFIVDTFSTFYIHPVRFPYEVLPVELVSFTGTNVGDKNLLKWMTATEQNTDKFVVEKSVDGINWFYLGEKPAAGNSSNTLHYELYDNIPLIGNNYYRLKMIDKDATFSYSQVINIPLREGAAIDGIIAVYPNPATNQLNVLISASASANTLMRVYDVTGKEMMSNGVSLQKGINTIELDISTLAKASYMLDISLNNKSFVEKFVKK